MTAKTLARWPDTDVNRSLGIVGRVKYWHPYELKSVMRKVAHRYPKTYEKVGNLMLKQGFDVSEASAQFEPFEVYLMWIAIMAAMPPHVIPADRGELDQTPWCEIDWSGFVKSLRP